MSAITGYALTYAPSGAPIWVDPAEVALDAAHGEAFVVRHPEGGSRTADATMFFASWPLAATAYDALEAAHRREANPWCGYRVKRTKIELRNGAAEMTCVVHHLRAERDEELIFPLERTSNANLGRFSQFVAACGAQEIDDSEHLHGRYFAMRIDDYGHQRFATLSVAL